MKTVMTRAVKAVMFLFCAGMIIHMNTITSSATQASGTVKQASAKIRSEASTTSTVLASVKSGDILDVTGKVAGTDGMDWYQVFVDAGTKGYIRSDLITVSGDVKTVEMVAASTTGSSSNSTTPAKIKSSANVRKEASVNSDIVTTLARGTSISIISKTTGDDGKTWYKLSLSVDGAAKEGYVREDLVTFGELEPVNNDPEVSEITGTMTDDPEGTTEGETGEPIEDPEDTADEEDTEDTQQDTQTTIKREFDLLEPAAEPVLPDGFAEVMLSGKGDPVRAWKNGDFYILYAVPKDSSVEGFYMYDSVEGTLQRYLEPSGTGTGSKSQMIIIIILAVVVVIMLIAVTLLLMKMAEYRAELNGEYDDEDDDEDDEDLRQPVRRAANPTARPLQQARPTQAGQSRPAGTGQPNRPAQGGQSRPSQQGGQSRPVQNGQSRPNQQSRPAQSGQSRPAGARPNQQSRPAQNGHSGQARPAGARTNEREEWKAQNFMEPMEDNMLNNSIDFDEEEFNFIDLDKLK